MVMKRLADLASGGLHRTLVASHQSLTRGQVWCHECGYTTAADSAIALRVGWPKHCGYTMSIDSPEERKALKERSTKERG